MPYRTLLAGAAIILLPAAAAAQDYTIFAGPKLSTLGAGGEIGVELNEHVSVRASGTVFQYDFNETLDDIDSSIELDLGAVGVQLDYFPFGNAFFVSGGVFSNLNDVNTSAQPSGPVEIGGTTYQPAEVGRITGNGDFADIAPYLGIGAAWGLGDSGNWQFVAEAGAYFQGEPEITYSATGQLANDPNFIADLQAEAASAEEDLDRLATYPVVSLTIRRRF